MARGWLKAISQAELSGRVQIVGFVDVDLDAANRLRAESGFADAVTGTALDAVLDATRPDIVFDIVVPGARANVVATALRRGCHVLSEKPLASSLDEARELIRLAKAGDRLHVVVQNRRYISGVRRIRRLIESGALGEVTALHADFFIGAHFGGFRDVMQNVLLLDMAIHTFDAARFMSGRNAVAVYCHESNPRGSWYRHGAAATAIFELEDEMSFTYRGSWAAEGANTSWESQWRIVGTRGTILWDGLEGFDARVVAGDEGFNRPLATLAVPEPADDALTHGHQSVIAEFLRAIETGRPPETVSTDNVKSLAMVFGAIESARTRQRVTLETI